MRAVRCHELSGPKALVVDEVEVPSPGSGEVLIDVKAAGVNFPDILITQGKYQFKPERPFCPGGEVAGIVEAVGNDVSGVERGDRVAATMLYGGFAEKVVVPQATVVRLPDEVPFEVAGGLLLTYATTLYALKDRAELRAGETLLVLGAAGGVGTAAIDVGKALGARVIAAASSNEKLAVCRKLGADEGINYAKENLKGRAKELAPAGIDVVYDPVGGDYAEQALRALGWEGRFLVVGFASGEIPRLPLNLVLIKSCQVVGVFWGAFVMREPDRNADNVAQLLTWLAEGTINPRIDATFRWKKRPQLLRRLQRVKCAAKLCFCLERFRCDLRLLQARNLAAASDSHCQRRQLDVPWLHASPVALCGISLRGFFG